MTTKEHTLGLIIDLRRNICEQKLSHQEKFLEEPYCPGVFDGYSCWNDTAANTTAIARCPFFVEGFDETRVAERYCDETGEWFRHPDTNRTWSNYLNCINHEDLTWSKMMMSTHEIGNTISVIALIISITILVYFRALRCCRTIVHINLFVSFAIHNVLLIAWFRFVSRYPKVIANNEIWCQMLHVVKYYSLLTNYTWMLCEGLYLHTVLISAFISDGKMLRWLYIIGWLIPLAPITIYVGVMLSDSYASKQCWMHDSSYNYEYILKVPVVVALALNVIFLCNIVRVLLIKLRAAPNAPAHCDTSRAALPAFRATLLLVPLLGLNYFLTPSRPSDNHPWVKVYDVISTISASLQGFCVATLFCFCNGEVISQIRRKWKNLNLKPRNNSCTGTTVSVRKHFRSATSPVQAEEEKV